MTDATIALIIHGVLAFLLAVGGGKCLLGGLRLLQRPDEAEVKNSFQATIGKHKVSFTAGTAGTCVVMTSVAWILTAAWVVPTYSFKSGEIKISKEIKFEPTQVAFADEQKADLDAFIVGLGKEPSRGSFKILSYANVDTRAMAEQRGEAVKQYLVTKHGIPPERTGLYELPYELASIKRPNGHPAYSSHNDAVVVFYERYK